MLYSYGDITNVNVHYINPDGTGDTAYANFNSNYLLATPNPTPAAANGNTLAFAYTADPNNPSYDIYIGKSVLNTSATQITSQGFSYVYSIQFTPDGTQLIFVATDTSGNSGLYAVKSDGTGLRKIDSADDAYLAQDGKSIAYTRFDANSGFGQIYTINIDGTGIRSVTNDAFDHFAPQFSKDSSRLTWTASPDGNTYNVYVAKTDGTQLTQVTSSAPDNAVSPAFNNDSTRVGYVLISVSNPANSGVYVVGINGLGNTGILLNATINSGLYWTSSTGFFATGHTSASLGTDYHIVRLKRLGRWH